MPEQRNCIKKEMPPDPTRHVMISDTFDSELFKKARRVMKCSENTASQAVLGQAIKEYSTFMGDPDLEEIVFKANMY